MTEAEYLLLCNILYIDNFSDTDYIGDEVSTIISKGIDIPEDLYTTPQEYQDLLNMAASTPSIAELELVSTFPDKDNTGARAACFVTPDGQPIVVFRGTGEVEWPDNMQGAILADTPAQKAALEWMKNLQEMGYDDFIVTGHSKGGNKAMYLAVVSGMVSQCYSFDGQGFSAEFMEKYPDEIAAMEGNIYSFSHKYDFVNILLSSIAENPNYMESYAWVNGFAEYHTPNALFKYEWQYDTLAKQWTLRPTLELATESEQSALMQVLSDFSRNLFEYTPPERRQEVVDFLSVLTSNCLGETEDQDLEFLFSLEQGTYILGMLVAHFKVLQLTNPELYDEAMQELFLLLLALIGKPAAESFMKNFNVSSIDLGGIFGSNPGAPMAGNSIVRDFTAEAKQVLLDTVKEVEEEDWFNITRWDCWYGAQQLLGGLNIEDHAYNISAYHRKLIDLNNSTADDIENLFSGVYEIDREYAGKINGHTATLEQELEKLKTAVDRLVPA